VILMLHCEVVCDLVASFIALRPIVIVDLLGIQKLTDAFGLTSLFQGIACLIGTPLTGTVAMQIQGVVSLYLYSALPDGSLAAQRNATRSAAQRRWKRFLFRWSKWFACIMRRILCVKFVIYFFILTCLYVDLLHVHLVSRLLYSGVSDCLYANALWSFYSKSIGS